jgi:hypothetical protein
LNYDPAYFSETVELNVWGTNMLAPVGMLYNNSLSAFWIPSVPPSVIAACATPSPDGVMHTNGPTGSGIAACGATNLGASGFVRIVPEQIAGGPFALPYTLALCDATGTPDGSCLGPIDFSLTYANWSNGQTKTFTIFAGGQGQTVTYDEYYHRLVIAMKNVNGWFLGGRSLAVTTN